MQVSDQFKGQEQAITDLFKTTFSASEGADEGRLIGDLVWNLLNNTDVGDLYVFTASENRILTGCILFTRLAFAGDSRAAFMLAPVAVATDWQRKGIGQMLIRHGLEEMAKNGAEITVTYGDPNYYQRTGFEQVALDEVPPPLTPQYPEGWMAQSLTTAPLGKVRGPSTCVPAFNDPDLW